MHVGTTRVRLALLWGQILYSTSPFVVTTTAQLPRLLRGLINLVFCSG